MPTVLASRRDTSIPPLDGARGVAALLVLMTHVGFVTGTYGEGGLGALLARFDVGVALFFALSGFLLTRPWVGGGSPGTRRYAVKRAARILPAYWVALVVVLLTSARGAGADAIASNATLTQVYTGQLLAGFTQTWSLCTEVAFYVVLPIVAPLLARRATRSALVILGAITVACWCWVWLAQSEIIPRIAAQWLPGHADWFAAGIALALLEPILRTPASRLHGRLREVVGSPESLYALAVVALALSCTALAGPVSLDPPNAWQAVIKEILYCTFAGLVILAAAFGVAGSPVNRALGSRAGRVLGRVSYGVFLWHLLAVDAVRSLLGLELFTGNVLIVGALSIALSYAIAETSWHLLERPILVRAGAHPR